MHEPSAIIAARKHLASAEAAFRSAGGLAHLEEGLALLDEVIAADDEHFRPLATNLALTYSSKILQRVSELLMRDPALPEPVLEHLFKVVLAFDHIDIDLPAESRSIKVQIARRLVDHYYEGHSA